jgi:hypothetical protein
VPGAGRHASEAYAFPTCRTDDSLDAFLVKKLDPWKCREAFFGIREGESESLRKFLHKVGLWLPEAADRMGEGHWSKDIRHHCEAGNPIPISVKGLLRFRHSLQSALLDVEAFKRDYAPTLTSPETGFELYEQSGLRFPLQFELTNVASGVIILSDAYNMLLATTLIDVARGIRFAICARESCLKSFPLKTKRRKIFCSPKCAHAACEKRNRPLRAKRI